MWRSSVVAIALGAAGCEWGGGADANGLTVPDAVTPDARHVDAPRAIDSPAPDAAIDAPVIVDAPVIDAAPPSSEHLLLTEVALAPSGGELVEIYNPTASAVDLSTYYLSDNGNYWKLPLGAPALSTGDFIVRFPAAASIPPAGVITVATGTAAAFHALYGVAPTYSIADATITHVATSGTPSLTDSGEIVVLFQWDGTSKLVKDVDLLLAGAPTPTNGLVSKSGVTQGGSAYATDAETIPKQASAPGAGKSTKRIAAEAGHETQAGTGNGLTGHDETSEVTTVTWDTTFTAPTPGQVPAGL